jgi:hypothetical protein
MLTDNINNDTIQLEANNNILNNSITELNELNILFKWNDKSLELFNVNNDINIRIINITNLISSTQNNINDLSTNIKNNKEEILALSKKFNKDCLHARSSYYFNEKQTEIDAAGLNNNCFISQDDDKYSSKIQCKYCHNKFTKYYQKFEHDSY